MLLINQIYVLECKDIFESKILLFLRIFFMSGNYVENNCHSQWNVMKNNS